jgi:pimeloyl-ACP methyl ester carboxylesterase
MATYALIHGSGDSAFYWHLVAPELRERGHDVVAVDLPCDDESAGLSEYADTVIEAIGARTDPIVVAQSFGAFTAPLVCSRRPVELMVLVAGMIPLPEERGDDWSANTGFDGAARNSGVNYSDELATCSTTTIASSRPTGCAASSATASGSRPGRSTAATARPSAARVSWRSAWRPIGPSSRPRIA